MTKQAYQAEENSLEMQKEKKDTQRVSQQWAQFIIQNHSSVAPAAQNDITMYFKPL